MANPKVPQILDNSGKHSDLLKITDDPEWLYKNSNSVVTRDPSVLYYDCTNYYFECEQPDEDVIDEVTGKLSMAAPPKILL